MSLEDDTDNAEIELRDLVNQTLEDNGILSKMRAQLRAGLYLALENDINTGYQYTYNETLKSKLAKPDIRIIFCLVREFLEYFELNFTRSVFDKETLMGTSYNYESREKLIQELDIGIDTLHNTPILLDILNIARSSFNVSLRDIKFNSTSNADINKLNTTFDLTAQGKFNQSEKNNTSSESASDVSQHVIGVKTVPKENIEIITTNNYPPDLNNQNANNEQSSDSKRNSVSSHEGIISEDAVVSKKNKIEDKFETDDTYEGTSSIAEDSSNNKEQNLIDLDKSVKLPSKNLSEQTLDESLKSPRLSFSPDSEKRKLDKTEKLKPMSGLTSLSDLPPLQLNKSRNSDTILLPSLYSKKSPLKEIDKLLEVSFDSLDNYEEDFMSSGSVDNDDTEENFNIKLEKENQKSLSSQNENTPAKTVENTSNRDEISEEFDINSNVDDLLKSDSIS